MSVDWWALGCSIYEMVAARLPFKDFKEKVQNEEVTRRTLEDECKYDHKHFNAPTKDIISRLLKKRVQNRLGCRYVTPRPLQSIDAVCLMPPGGWLQYSSLFVLLDPTSSQQWCLMFWVDLSLLLVFTECF